jgi:hypothetical protein
MILILNSVDVLLLFSSAAVIDLITAIYMMLDSVSMVHVMLMKLNQLHTLPAGLTYMIKKYLIPNELKQAPFQKIIKLKRNIRTLHLNCVPVSAVAVTVVLYFAVSTRLWPPGAATRRPPSPHAVQRDTTSRSQVGD